MLRLTQTTGYAIKCLACLACDSSRQTAEIATSAGIPRAYLSKIIQSLSRAGLVNARRGIGGGICLSCSPQDISLLQVVEAVEGHDWLGECLLGFDECTNQITCPTHDFWQRIRTEIIFELRRTTLASIIGFRAQCQESSPIKPRGKSPGPARTAAPAPRKAKSTTPRP